MTEFHHLVDIAANGAITAREGDEGATYPILSQDERGQTQARRIAASVLDALVQEGVIARESGV